MIESLLTNIMLITAGKDILRTMKSKLPAEQHVSMKFRKGWVHRFQKGYKLCSLQSYDESRDVPDTVVQNAPGTLQEDLSPYSLHDCFIADELELFYKMAPDRTVVVQRLFSRKKETIASLFLHVQIHQVASGFLCCC